VKAIIVFLLICLAVFGVMFAIITNLPKPQYVQVDIHDLVKHPENYKGHHVNTTGWLGDTGEFERTTILIPLIISTGKSTIIIWIPISDNDYYYAVYKDNSFTKGILIKLENKPSEDLLGNKVTALGKLVSQKVKIEGETKYLWLIKGSVDKHE